MQKVCSFDSLCTFSTSLWPIICAYTNLRYPAKGVKYFVLQKTGSCTCTRCMCKNSLLKSNEFVS